MKFSLLSKPSALLCSCAILSLTFLYPYSGDNVLFAYITDLFLRGIPPYAGAWDHAFPGVMIVHTLQLTLLGKSPVALHVVDILIQLFVLSSVYNLARRIRGEMAGWLACTIYAIFYVTRGSNMIAITDVYVACLIVIALDLAFRGKRNSAAFVFGLAIIFRPTYGLLSVLYVLYDLWDQYRQRQKLSFIPLFSAALPSLLLIGAFGTSGHFDEFFISVWTYNVEVYNRYVGFEGFFDPILEYVYLFFPAILGIGLALRYYKVHKLILLTFIGSIVALLLLIHAPYQYPPIGIHLALFAGIGWGIMIEFVSRKSVKLARALPIAVTIVLLLLSLRGTTLAQSLRAAISGEASTLLEAQSYFEPSRLWGIVPQEHVTDFLKKNTTPSNHVQGLAPLYPQFMAGVLPSNRFIIPLGFGIRAEDGRLKDYQVEWRKEYIRDLEQLPPKYYIIADSSQDARPFLNGLMPHEFIRKDFNEIGQLLDRSYRLDTTIGSFFIYRYRNSAN